MLLSVHPTPGTANIAAWVNTQVHFLTLRPKCKRQSAELESDTSEGKKKNTSHLGRCEMARGYLTSWARKWRGVDVGASTQKKHSK